MTELVEQPRAAIRPGYRGPTDRWYVTSPATEARFVGGDIVVRPVGIAHAKEMGTTMTACGLWAYSWRGMLELSFPLPPLLAPGVQMCPDCVGVVIGDPS